MTEKTEIENQLATLAIDNDQEIANFVDLIDSSLEPYRVNVSKLGLEAGRRQEKAYKVSMRPIRQASLEGLGLHIDEEAFRLYDRYRI
jgi:hypothetical protein